MQLNISVVLYQPQEQEVEMMINQCLKTAVLKNLYLVDNSQTPLTLTKQDIRLTYIHTGTNLGYGKAHNIAIRKSIETKTKYHLVLNPDIEFNADVLERICAYMDANTNVGQVMPKILFKDGSLQRLCKLLPTPFNLIGRRFLPKNRWAENLNKKYELGDFSYNNSMELANLSGCFMFVRTAVFEQVGVFDERFFMYLEDIDLTRRIHEVAKTIFYPDVSVFHGYKKESYSNKLLLKYHIRSAIKYFNKWGWIFDKKRTIVNKSTLEQLKLESK